MDDLAINRAMWDERVPVHLASEFYDVDGFRSGRVALEEFEIGEVGEVTGRRLCHLQCHFGMDTLAWARLGASVVGLDFSPAAVAAARDLAAETGLAGEATFVEGTVEEARQRIEGYFDVVYVTWGALIWLPDLERWAGAVASLLRPGGFLYLAEGHPYSRALQPDQDGGLRQVWPYGGGARLESDVQGTYADPDAVLSNTRQAEWCHGLGEIVSAVAGAGLRVDWLHERPELVWPQWPTMDQGEDGLWRQPRSGLPQSFSLRATRPG